MSELNKGLEAAERKQTEGMQTLDKLFAVAQPGAVYSEPVQADGQTVITLSEVTVGMGFGFGIGEGSGTPPPDKENTAPGPSGGSGGGGGGGGFSAGRPVAIVTVNANGVKVEPVVDVTKLTIAFFTAFGAMALMLARMNRLSRR